MALLAVGCRGGASLADDVGRNMDDAVRAFDQSIPQRQLPTMKLRANNFGDELARSAERRTSSYDEAKQLVGEACQIKDLAAGQVFENPPSVRVRELAEDLKQAETSGDAARELAVFLVCEWR
jgi:hypothetical protein